MQHSETAAAVPETQNQNINKLYSFQTCERSISKQENNIIFYYGFKNTNKSIPLIQNRNRNKTNTSLNEKERRKDEKYKTKRKIAIKEMRINERKREGKKG